MFATQNVSASEVLSTRDMNVRPGRDVTEIGGQDAIRATKNCIDGLGFDACQDEVITLASIN